MSVEDSAAIDSSTAAPIETSQNDAVSDAALEAIWNKNERDNGAARSEDGRFASANPDPAADETQKPLEGGEGEATAAAETSTPAAVEVPLPPNWNGMDDVWKDLPPEKQQKIAAHQAKIHEKVSQQGRALSFYEPIGNVIHDFKEYFGGERGNYKPEEAIQTLFTIQRNMDDKPIETILQIADTYQIREKLAEALGQPAGDATQQQNSALLAEIGQLKQEISRLADPSKVDERISQKLVERDRTAEVTNLFSRVAKDIPLANEVNQATLDHFIIQSREVLGQSASGEAVLKRAYDMAINADPDLRTKAAALKSAAAGDQQRVADAKRANSTNIRSTSTGAPRQATDDELLGDVWAKHNKG